MARATRYSQLETRTGRDKLKITHEPHWVNIGQGLYLGYRKNPKQGGAWFVRFYINNRKYKKHRLGNADDYRDANNIDVLNYFQAQNKAREYANEQTNNLFGIKDNKPITVREALNNYLAWFKTHRKSYERTAHIVRALILPELGEIFVDDLTPKIIREWHEKLTYLPPRKRSSKVSGVKYRELESSPEAKRQRKASANRILTVLKAALNHAWRDGFAASDEAWRKVKPFHNVDAPKIRYLSLAECERLINACEPGFRQLIRAALLTGCRYGELTRLTANDYDSIRGTLHILETKNGKPRYIPLTDEGKQFFEHATVGRLGKGLIFTRADGGQWGVSHQSRRLIEACKIAKIEPAISFHILRHTYGSLLASKGVPLQVIAELLGHSDTRITSKHYAHLMPSFVSETLRANLPSFSKNLDNSPISMSRASK